MKKLITELDVDKLWKDGHRIIPVGENEILTPLAKDRIKQKGFTIVNKDEANIIQALHANANNPLKFKKAAIGSDHTGFKVKNIISKILSEKGFLIIDVGTYDEKSCDYPDFALAVAKKLLLSDADFGIIIDATGNPSAITANKLPGIRAANCYNEFTAKSAREHNNSNIITLGAKALGEESIKSILEVWLNTDFGGGRHQKRLDKISAVEKQYLK